MKINDYLKKRISAQDLDDAIQDTHLEMLETGCSEDDALKAILRKYSTKDTELESRIVDISSVQNSLVSYIHSDPLEHAATVEFLENAAIYAKREFNFVARHLEGLDNGYAMPERTYFDKLKAARTRLKEVYEGKFV